MKQQIGVIGGGTCADTVYAVAHDVGREIARNDCILVCGGLGGVMEAACRGARQEGGVTVGIIPGTDRGHANRFVDVVVVTGMGHARNMVVVHSADALIAIDGGTGTLSEIAIGLTVGKPIVGIQTWDLGEGIIVAENAHEAVRMAIGKIS